MTFGENLLLTEQDFYKLNKISKVKAVFKRIVTDRILICILIFILLMILILSRNKWNKKSI